MRIPNLLTAHEDYYDYLNSNLPLDGPGSSTLIILLKIILINLTYGCIITALLFKLRGFIGRAFRALTCGFCDGCECDGTTPYYSRRSRSRSRSSRFPNRQFKNKTSKEDRIFRKQLIVSLMGAACAVFCFYTFPAILLEHRIGEKEPPTLIHSFSSHALFTKNRNDPGRLFVITPTEKSGIQIPRLTRLAQALFPHRNFVTWVLVSTDPSLGLKERWTMAQLNGWITNETRVMSHLEDLRETVERFGIPFVLLSGHAIHHRNAGFKLGRKVGVEKQFVYMRGTQIGISWVVKTFQSGVFHVTIEDASYDSSLFKQIQNTTHMSSWPVAFNPQSIIGLTAPLISGNSTDGYFSGRNGEQFGMLSLEHGSYALNIRVARELRKRHELWKLSTDGDFTSTHFNIALKDTQALKEHIYVWRLTTSFTHANVFKRRIPFRNELNQTNIPVLLNKVTQWFILDKRM